ncbi:Phytochrome B-like protein [Drosera capensis]
MGSVSRGGISAQKPSQSASTSKSNFRDNDNTQNTHNNNNNPSTKRLLSTLLMPGPKGWSYSAMWVYDAIDESSFRVVAYSENAREMLGINPHTVPGMEKPEILTIGTDVRTLFTPSSGVLLEKAFGAREFTLLNPFSFEEFGKALSCDFV